MRDRFIADIIALIRPGDPNMKKVFVLTPDLVKLLNNMYVDWQDCEFGAPCIDPKRPYGNSYVEGDVAEILGVESEEEDFQLTDSQMEKMGSLHRDTQTALQVVLSTKSFEPGIYFGDHNKWELVDTFGSNLANCLVHPEKQVRDYAQKILKGRT